MKVLLIHNDYGVFSGEEAVFERHAHILRTHGHEVEWLRRSSVDIGKMFLGRARAFVTGIYSWRAARAATTLLQRFHPDIVHVQNIYPLLSPSVIVAAKRHGAPVVMTLQNYRLSCPSGLHQRNGNVCEECLKHSEWRCISNNCEGNWLKSVGYAVRNYAARRFGWISNHVDRFVCLTEFHRRRLVEQGVCDDHISVVPNMYGGPAIAGDSGTMDDYVLFAGRISPEKGVPVLLEAAKRVPHIPMKIAGPDHRMPWLKETAPRNVAFVGAVAPDDLSVLYSKCRLFVLCSTWYEGMPMVLIEAMMHGRPIVAPRIGGIPEVVEEGKTGLLFEPGNPEDLAAKIRLLYESQSYSERLGASGREKAHQDYSVERYYDRIMSVYGMARSKAPRDGGLRCN